MKNIKKYLLVILLMTSAVGFFGSLIDNGFSSLLYFTNQSNFLVFLVVLGMLTKKPIKHLEIVGFVVFMNILMTGIIFNTLLKGFEATMSPIHLFYSYLNHTVNPILYTIVFLAYMRLDLTYKKFYVLLVYPLVYFMAYMVTGPFTKFYPYPFMNPIELGLKTFLITNVLVLLPILVLFSLFLIHISKTLHQKIDKP
ncbi:MAG: Pr6Pr family membrane protein [Acholeplasma sp.]|nr:Pr6Pr family membrane protein [Acholeplasma sp.]